MLRKMKRIFKVMFKTRTKEWAKLIPPSRKGHVNIASHFPSKQIITLEGKHVAEGDSKVAKNIVREHLIMLNDFMSPSPRNLHSSV